MKKENKKTQVKNQGKILYISDLHLFHNKILELCDRPFGNVQQMHETIIRNWKRKVKIYDTVYILGDVGMFHANEIADILKSLPGNKYLITGNHDKWNLRNKHFSSSFEDISPFMEIKDNGRKVVLSHYPMEEWDGYFKGFYHVHGHVHKNDDELKRIERRYNVSADRLNFEPCTLDEIIELDKAYHYDELLKMQSVEKIEYLQSNTPDGVIYDADTILADITEKNVREDGMNYSGLAMDIFSIWKKSRDKKSVEMMFFEFTDMEFLEYLDECLKKITRNNE